MEILVHSSFGIEDPEVAEERINKCAELLAEMLIRNGEEDATIRACLEFCSRDPPSWADEGGYLSVSPSSSFSSPSPPLTPSLPSQPGPITVCIPSIKPGAAYMRVCVPELEERYKISKELLLGCIDAMNMARSKIPISIASLEVFKATHYYSDEVLESAVERAQELLAKKRAPIVLNQMNSKLFTPRDLCLKMCSADVVAKDYMRRSEMAPLTAGDLSLSVFQRRIKDLRGTAELSLAEVPRPRREIVRNLPGYPRSSNESDLDLLHARFKYARVQDWYEIGMAEPALEKLRDHYRYMANKFYHIEMIREDNLRKEKMREEEKEDRAERKKQDKKEKRDRKLHEKLLVKEEKRRKKEQKKMEKELRQTLRGKRKVYERLSEGPIGADESLVKLLEEPPTFTSDDNGKKGKERVTRVTRASTAPAAESSLRAIETTPSTVRQAESGVSSGLRALSALFKRPEETVTDVEAGVSTEIDWLVLESV